MMLLALHGMSAAAGTQAPPYPQVRERPIPRDPVKIDSGLVAGKLLPSGVEAYFGVPFAAPPVGGLRWREPQPVHAWSGVLDAGRPAPECIQVLRAHDINNYFGEEATSEDCLYLNIWAPPGAASGDRRPVVAWIYGGGFTIGSASMANYSGETLARKGVVYVAIAYRVGAFGFLALPALTAESPHHTSGDVGSLDQIAALQWIQRNIGVFGGDPRNVTIMGQSAGSMSVSVLQSSPLARGLFHRVVGMSGSEISNDGPRSLAAAEAEGSQLQEQLQAADLAGMRSLPADRILQAAVAARTRFGPLVDGYVLPATPAEIFAAGKQSDVPALIGFVHDESFSELGRVMSLKDYEAEARKLYGNEAAGLLRLYPAKNDAEAARSARDAGRDSSVALQMRSWARAQAATGRAPVYAYLFSRVHPYAPGISFSDHDPKTVGAYHSGDIPYWLGTQDAFNMFRVTRDWTQADRALSDQMSSAIVAFAATGNPNQNGANDWPVYGTRDELIRELDVHSRVVAWPDSGKMDFFLENHPQDRSAASPALAPAAAPGVAAHAVLDDRYPERRVSFPGGVVGLPDLVYAALPGFRPLRLDLYEPPQGRPGPHPLVVLIHGGGWSSGHTRHSGAFEDWPAVLASLAARGYVVASVEYRLSGEAKFPAAIQDVKSAIRWLRARSKAYGIDKNKALVWGGSAGGQLAALAATSCGAKALEPSEPPPGNSPVGPRPEDSESDCVQGLIAWYGIFDFATLAPQSGRKTGQVGTASSPPSRFLGCGLSSCPAQVLQSASAAHYASRTSPPTLLIHGVEDHSVPVQQSRDFNALLRSKGVPVELVEIPGVDHSFIGPTAEATRAASLQALRKSFDFIDRTIGSGLPREPGPTPGTTAR